MTHHALLPEVFGGVGPTSTYVEVDSLLQDAGWRPCGSGDWAFALVDPEGSLVARLSPFDPIGPVTARLYEEAAQIGPVPRLDLHRRLAGGADLQVMERLEAVEEPLAAEFLERFAVPAPELAPLAAVVRRIHAEALRTLPWCGPLDTNPSNIMRSQAGDLVMIDPFYADGPALYAMAAQDPDRFVTTIPQEERRHLTEIPLAVSGPWPTAEREELRSTVRAADERRRAAPPTADELIAEAAAADVDGWGFAWLDGRAAEERPPWRYRALLADAVAGARRAVDLDTGGGEVLDECPRLAAEQHATEGWPPNAARARERLGPRGAHVHEVAPDAPLPFDDATFDLVTARHPVVPPWDEIARVLAPGGRYLGQHVGPSSAFELIEFFIGPTTVEQRRGRHPDDEVAAAGRAGLEVTGLRSARLRMEFSDVGAVVWILRKCVWWVPGFDVDRFRDRLLAMDETIRRDGPFVAHSTRHLIEARRAER